MRAIAGSLLVVSLVLHPCVGHASWQTDGVGVAIVPQTQDQCFIIPDGTGGTIITWEDARNVDYGYDVYAQRLNGAGVDQWPSNGVAVCSAPGDQYYPLIAPDGGGGAIVMWFDNRNGNVDVYAQRVNGSGVVQWTTNGVAVCTAVGDQGLVTNPSFISDGSGGAIVTWADPRNGGANFDIYAQRVSGSGVPQWTANGVALCAAAARQVHPTIVTDAAGGAIVTWYDERNGLADIYAQRVNGSGVVQWTVDGVAVCSAVDAQKEPMMIPLAGGGAIMTWEDHRNGTDIDIYAQQLNASGVAQWNLNGVALCSAPGDQFGATPVSDGAGGAIVAWDDNRNANIDIFAQRIGASGVAAWTANGEPLCTAPGDQVMYPLYDQIASDGFGGAYVTWVDRSSDANDIYAQQVNGSGIPQYAPNGAALCTAAGVQDFPAITYIGNSVGAVVSWEDRRNEIEPDIYALPVPNTRVGTNVRYVPIPYTIPEQPYPVRLLFDHVVAAGYTYLNITAAGPALPPSFGLGDGRYYNLSTTAGTTGNIDVCIKFDPAALQHPAFALRMFQYNADGPSGPTWLDITTGAAAGDSICGTTTSLSTFVFGYPSVTGVGDTPAPASFALDANVPNPFNPITTIRYDVPAPGADVSISVYDVEGRLVRELVKEHRNAGVWSAQWNGDNDRGQGVASGVYFYRMRAGAFIDTKKMVLLK